MKIFENDINIKYLKYKTIKFMIQQHNPHNKSFC